MSQAKRELPEEQQQDIEGAGEIMPYDKAKELADQFEEIQTATIGDGLLRGSVQAIEASPNNAAISVEVDVPAETEPVQFFLDKPKSWTRDYDFVRWVEDHGYMAGDFQGMIEKNVRVEVKREDGDYELVIPERVTDKSRKLKPALKLWATDKAKTALQSEIAVPLGLVVTSIFLGNFIAAMLVFTGDVLAFALFATVVGSLCALCGLVVGLMAHDKLQ